MFLHKEGTKTIGFTFLFLVVINLLAIVYTNSIALVLITSVIVLSLVVQFFRNPNRQLEVNDYNIVAPVDGKVVVIEEVFEPECQGFKGHSGIKL